MNEHVDLPNYIDKENRSARRTTWLSATLSITYPAWDWFRLELGRPP